MNASKTVLSLILMVAISTNFVDAYCWAIVEEGDTCFHTFPNKTVGAYSIGESWIPAPCQKCSCSVDGYEDYFTCYMPAQSGYKIINKIAPIFKIQLANSPSKNCPPGFQPMGVNDTDIDAQFFLTYQVISRVLHGCCDNKESISFLPKICKPLRHGKDDCQVSAVLKNDESQLCPMPWGTKGR